MSFGILQLFVINDSELSQLANTKTANSLASEADFLMEDGRLRIDEAIPLFTKANGKPIYQIFNWKTKETFVFFGSKDEIYTRILRCCDDQGKEEL